MVNIPKQPDSTYKLPYETRGSMSPTTPSIEQAKVKEMKDVLKLESKKQACLAKGGFWDEATKTCITDPTKYKYNFKDIANMPNASIPGQSKKEIETPKEVKPSIPEIIKDLKTGEITGLTLPNGETFVINSPRDISEVISRLQDYQGRTELPAGTQPAGTAQAAANRQARLQQLNELGMQGLLSPQEIQAIQEAPIDWGQAITAGAANVFPSAIGGAAGGAVIGGLSGGAPAALGGLIGGIGGLLTGFSSGLIANIKSQQKGEINAAVDVLQAAKTNMKAYATLAKADPTKAEEALEGYYFWINEAHKAHRKTQLETQGNLNKWMEDGTDTLSDFELFLMPGGTAERYKAIIDTTIYNPNPATPEELLKSYMELNEDE